MCENATTDRRGFLGAVGVATALALAGRFRLAEAAISPRARSVVLVHGLYADGSSWTNVIGPLLDAGLHVTSVQNPLTTLADSVAATRRALVAQQGPTFSPVTRGRGPSLAKLEMTPRFLRSSTWPRARRTLVRTSWPLARRFRPRPPARASSRRTGSHS